MFYILIYRMLAYHLTPKFPVACTDQYQCISSLCTLGAIHQGRPAYLGEGVLEIRTSIVISTGILLLNPDSRWRGG